MKIALPSLLPVVLLAAACEPPVENGSIATNDVDVSNAATGNADAVASIMRPEVAEEAAVAPAAAPPEPLRAIIPFGESGAELSDAGKKAIDSLMADPRFAGGGEIALAGHTDSNGSDAGNLAVSRRRAEVVRDYLASKGVGVERMTVIALGERRPLEPNANPNGTDFPEGRAQNRRVEIEIAPSRTIPAEPSPSEHMEGTSVTDG